MFAKVLGALLAVGTATLAGYYFAGMDKYRLKELLEIKKALIILKSEINYSLSELSEAFETIAAKTEGKASEFFAMLCQALQESGVTVYSAWQASIERAFDSSYLNTEDKESLGGLGQTLGYIDRDMQLCSMDMVIDYIDVKANELNESSAKNQKLYTSLGVMAGLLVTIVLF